MLNWLPYVPSVGALAAVAGTIIAAVALNRAGRNLREQLRPVVVVALRPRDEEKGVIEIVVTNYGQQLARDVQVTFNPEIADPDDGSERMTSSTTMLVRQFAQPTSVLAPRASILQIYYDFGEVVGGRTFMGDAPTPKRVEATVKYFSPEGMPYEDDFELDVSLAALRPIITKTE